MSKCLCTEQATFYADPRLATNKHKIGNFMDNKDFMLLSIQNLLDRVFFISRYQRGYRWTAQQVLDLLNDIDEIDGNEPTQKYCLQPLVVTQRECDCLIAQKGKTERSEGVKWYLVPVAETKECNASFEVIDGQQRLTTIFILLKHLGVEYPYAITYETRDKSQDFLKKIGEKSEENDDNIDFHYMSQCYQTINEWLKDKDTDAREEYLKKLLTKIYFIWYEDDSGKPVETFTRLNIGKIALTNAELIKAMLLKQSNFEETSFDETFRLTQLEMASQWDEIEYTLQNDDFWYFIHPQGWTKPTRIDFVFDILKEMNLLEFTGKTLGNDNYTTFRYFYQFLKASKGSRKAIWDKVRKIFQIFREWFNDAVFYHYVGFLTATGVKLAALVTEWNKNDKTGFTTFLKDKIKTKMQETKNLNNSYGNNRDCLPLLLLFNVQTAINQNQGYKAEKGNCLFYKFPVTIQNMVKVPFINHEKHEKTRKNQFLWRRNAAIKRFLGV